MNRVKQLAMTAIMALLTASLLTSIGTQAGSNPFSSLELVTINAEHTDGKCGVSKMKVKSKKCGR